MTLDERSNDPDEDARPSPQTFVRASLVFYGVLGCVALLWRMSTPGESIFHPSATSEPSFTFLTACLLGAGVGGMALAASEALTRWTEMGELLTQTLAEGLAGISRADAILMALASGLAEEMFFRGALQPAVGIFWASLLFGSCHFMPRKELLIWSLYAVVIGFGFGVLYEWTGQLIAPILAHTVVNAVNLPRLAARSREGEG